ncbi:MAG: serine hydrolase domain-containing protein [Moraxella sp.]|nr:serine hydrolase domain-containing protein [Moraxella sp.]
MNWQKIGELLPALQFDDNPCGGAMMVYHRGECVLNTAFGQANKTLDWHTDTLSVNFSIGKGVMSTLIAVLVSRGILSYSTPISEYWAAFGANGKYTITLTDVLTHTAGLFDITSIIDSNEQALDWHAMLDKVANMPTATPQGQAVHHYGSAYSALVSGWVLGGVVEHATGKSLQAALDEYLAIPLGVQGELFYGLPADKLGEIAVPLRLFDGADNPRRKPTLKPDSEAKRAFFASLPFADKWRQCILDNGGGELNTANINRVYFDSTKMNMTNYKHALIPDGKTPLDYHNAEFLQVPIPAANGVSTANALAKIYAVHANDGVWQGQQLINTDVMNKLRCTYTQGFDAVMPADMGWRLGFHRLFNVQGATSAYGHMGYNGSVAFCDPVRELAVAFIHNFDTTMLNDVRQFVMIEAALLAGEH